MSDSSSTEKDFLNQLDAVIQANMEDERFGVSELAAEMNMSRSNLLRKVKKETQLSVSQLINQRRLKRAMDLLRTSALNVSEVANRVGFNSTSYFIKCFREYYGHPPGEVGKRSQTEEISPEETAIPVKGTDSDRKKRLLLLATSIVLACMLGVAWYVSTTRSAKPPVVREKSIAVLPFKNDSNDSSNVYLINGIMEATLNNLQKIKDLRVISRTSTEKYRDAKKTIHEMAEELDVAYFVEGSGQKIGDRILLNIQLIDGANDSHLWARQFRVEVGDIFAMQQEIAKNITDEIQVIITPEEKKRIEKIPTTNLVAYDLYLQGSDLLKRGGRENLEKSVSFFKQALEHDPQFALAHAETAIAYYYLDIFQRDKKFEDETSQHADKALLFDPKLTESLAAKALVYIQRRQYELALPYLEKALEYNPNSGAVIGFLSDFHNNYIPNTAKYLEYALMGTRLGFNPDDSVTTSYNYLRLADALMQTGFIDESLTYVGKSLAFNPENYYARWVKIWVMFARDGDASVAKKRLIEELERHTEPLVMLEEIGKICYLMRDYGEAYQYYKKFIELREARQMDIFRYEDLKIAVVLEKMGQNEKAAEHAATYKEFADRDRSVYHNLHLAAYHAYLDNSEEAMRHLKLFSKEDNFQYWILFLRTDPVVDKIRKHKDFTETVDMIEKKFWDNHRRIRRRLEEKGLVGARNTRKDTE